MKLKKQKKSSSKKIKDDGKEKHDGGKRRLPETKSSPKKSSRIKSGTTDKSVEQGTGKAAKPVKLPVKRTTKAGNTTKAGKSKKYPVKNWDI